VTGTGGSATAPAAVAATYRAFARREVRGRSPAYEALALAAAADRHGTWLRWLG
jgi:hypothetical protein